MNNIGKNGISRNEKIIDLFNKMDKNELILRPSFQRNLVWNNQHKESFLKTILLGYPFPEVYFADGEMDLETMTVQILVVDGQQRLDTIYKYISDDKDLILKDIPRYRELNDDEKKKFLNYNVVIRDLGKNTDDEIKEIFKRINSVSYALNAIEINNALYDGEYINLAKELLSNCILYDLNVFSKNDAARMRDLEYLITIISTIEIGAYFTSISENAQLIQQYDNEYDNAKKMKEIMKQTFDIIEYLNLSDDRMWVNKTCMFSLICEVAFIIKRDKSLDKEKCKIMLLDLEKKIRTSKEGDKEYEFTYYMIQATGSKKGRRKRGEILREKLLRCII